MERKFNPFRRGEIPGIQISRIRSRRRRGGAREPRTAQSDSQIARIGPKLGHCVRSQYTKTSLSYPRRLQFAPPPVQHVASTTLDSLTLQTARRERQPHTAEIGWRGSAVTDEIQWAESPFFEIPILSFEGRVGNR